MDVVRDQISSLLEKENLDILMELLVENVLSEWLNCQQLDFQSRLDVLKLIAKACSGSVDRETHTKFIRTLVSLEAPFVTFMVVFLSTVQSQEIDCDVALPLRLIFSVILSVFQCLPVSSMNFVDIILPQLESILKKLPEEGKGQLASDITELLQQRENMLLPETGCHDKSKKENESHPPCDFRDISLLPSKEEFESQVRPYLRANVVKGAYENADHYLDVQFRLMREDMFRYLRESIAEYKRQKWSRDSSALLQNGHVYFDAKIVSRKYSNGVFFFADVYIGKKVDWSTTKRLMSNSLLCMSSDGFETFTFAYVRSSHSSHTDALSCVLKFSTADDEEYVQLGKQYDIIETTSFYESYRYVLKRLQLFREGNFPLSSPILFLKNCDKKPEYWKKNSYFLGGELGFEKSAFQEMMNSKKTLFDEHQHRAFQMALSNQVSLIQGPPGTGKTYLGLQIVKWLVQKASMHMETPILVICYTNHALDQFLEGILKFTEKVVRIGGQSKNLSLRHHNINKIAHALLKKYPEDEPWLYDEMELLTIGLHETWSYDEMQSRTIGLNIMGSTGVLERVGCYTRTVKESEETLQNLEDLINQLDKNPLYSETVMFKHLPRNLLSGILGPLVTYKRVRALQKYLIRGIESWLCISVSFLHVYEELPELLSEIVKEYLEYIRDNGYLNRNVTLKKYPEKALVPENKFVLSLWKLFLKGENWAPIADLKISPKEVDDHVRSSLRAHSLDKSTIFKFLEKAASKCLEPTHYVSELEYQEIWSAGLLERWKIFLHWKSDVRNRMIRKLNLLKYSYIVDLEEREKVRFENNVKIAKRADILGLTTTGAAKHWQLLEKIGPYVVVAEEAAEVSEAHIITALTKSTKHLILIGDHKQLRPIPSVYELARRFKLDVSMFERLLVNGVPSVCLQTQHRMRPCIAELLVPEIYDNLENHPVVQEYEDIKGMANNMYFIKHNVYEDDNSDLRSHRNKHEADFIVRLCHYLLQQGYHEDSITILTTYAGQLKLLSEITNRKLNNNVHVTTVDNFQGEENDIILLSFVRSNQRNSLGFLEISNRVCVALSRARKGLFCIGNFDSFARKCKTWKNIIQKLKEKQLISSTLPLKCQNHPTKVTLVSRASDFDKVLGGGCTEKCTYRLACGHVCPLQCHIATKDHGDMFCSKKCQKQHERENNTTTELCKKKFAEVNLVEFPQVASEILDYSSEYEYGSDDYETDNNFYGSVTVAPDREEEYWSEESPVNYEDKGQDTKELNNESETEETPVSYPFINSGGESVNLESHNQPQCSTKQLTVSVLQKNEDPNVLQTQDEIMTNELLQNEVKQLNILQTEHQITPNEFLHSEVKEFGTVTCKSESVVTYSPQALSSELSMADVSVVQNKSEGNCRKDGNIVCTPRDVTLHDRKSENVECYNNNLRLPESIGEICLSKMLSNAKLERHSSSFKQEVQDDHTQEHICEKDKLLDILRPESDVKNFGSEANDVSSCAAHVTAGEIFATCDSIQKQKVKCNAVISKKLQCRHEITVPCNKYNLHYDCTVVVDVELPCLHVFSVKCRDWIWMKEIRCKVSVPLLMPCGKIVRFVCSEGPYHADCIATVLKCGHRVPCYTDVDKYKCEVPVKCILPCFHETYVPCVLYYYSEKLKVAREVGPVQTILQKLCGKRCSVLLECGHWCLGKCGDCTYDRKHYTCSEKVKRDLPCGHQMECECNAKDILCRGRCNVLMECGHRCSGKCGSCTIDEKHPKCCELVTRDLPCKHRIQCKCHVKDPCCSERCNFLMDCNHRCSGECGACISAEKHHACSEMVRAVLPCGHQIETECNVKNPTCNVKCEVVLSCGHYCPGKCGECFTFQIHAMCSELVNRQLPCGHCVKWPCGSPLPVCEKRCLFGCQHSQCINSCFYPCMKCFKPCDWKCEHFACSSKCSDLCNRPPCDVRCPKSLACGHQCCGYCGEPCPNLCVLCDRVSVSNTHGGSNWYVLLENCQHSILMEDLNIYFTQKSKTSCPMCPECKTVITRNKRFGNCIKSWLSSNLHNNSTGGYADISSFSNCDTLDTCVSEMIEKNISLAFISRTKKMIRGINLLQKVRKVEPYSTSSSTDLYNEIKSLEKWLLSHCAMCSKQQVEESSRAVRRLCALWYLQKFTEHITAIKSSDHYCSELRALLESKPFAESEERKVIEFLEQNVLKDDGKDRYSEKLLRLIRSWNSSASSSEMYFL